MNKHTVALHDLLQRHPQGLTIAQITQHSDINRNSVARYLDVLESEGLATSRIVGPAKLYVAKKGLPKTTEIELYKRAMDQASCGIVIADAQIEDFPLIYVNAEFLSMTGYEEHEVLGKNCRFLQGPKTDKKVVQKIKAAIKASKPVEATLLNYRKDGTTFKNNLRLSPVRNDAGKLTHYIGVQTKL